MPSKPTPGKGGNIETRKNPFNSQAKGSAPPLADLGRVGLVLDMVTRAGCAILIGHTRDGGAVVITILDGDSRHRTYCSTPQELEDALGAIEDMYED